MKRKIFALFTIVALTAVFAAGCVKTNGDGVVQNIFENFSSTGEYVSAEAKLKLGEGQTFSGYDAASNTFIIKEDVDVAGVTITRYGLASDTEIYVEPASEYGCLQVLDINGDHAIVVASTFVDANETAFVGIIRFRGPHGKLQYGFVHQFAPLIQQVTFLNDRYVVMYGDMQNANSESGYTYATIYDYVSADKLLEVARIPNIDNGTSFMLHDNYIAATNGDSVRFYNINEAGESGYLTEKAYVKLITGSSYAENGFSTSTYYLGGGWFIVSTSYSSETEYDGYEFTRTEDDTTYFMEISSVKISMQSLKTFRTERVTMVANKYSETYVRGLADSITTEDVTNAANWDSVYAVPITASSQLVRDGYSIVYYYYYFYNDEDETQRTWSTSFQIYDSSGEASVASNLAMPVVYADGYGLQTADPNFNIALRDVGYHTYADGSRVTLIALDANNGYHNAFIHDGVIISFRQHLDATGLTSNVGAVGVDGKLILPFEYDAVSPFFGNYATASKVAEYASDGSILSQAFYRVAKDGTVTSIPECYQMRNGTYVTYNADRGKYGLNSNSGKVLISAECDSVSTVDYMYADGKVFAASYAVTVENGRGVLYELV